MKPLLIIDGKPRLYDGPIRYIEWTENHEPVAGTYAFVVTRDGQPHELADGVRSVRPSGRPVIEYRTGAR